MSVSTQMAEYVGKITGQLFASNSTALNYLRDTWTGFTPSTVQYQSTNTNVTTADTWKSVFRDVGTAAVQAYSDTAKTVGVWAIIGGVAYLLLKNKM